MALSLLDAGELFVIMFRKLIIGPDVRPLRLVNQNAGESKCLLTCMLPFVLGRAGILDYIEVLVDRLLLQMSKLESMTIQHWDDLLPATLGPVSGTGALNGNASGYTIALLVELIRILEPVNQLPSRYLYKLLRILLRTSARLRQLVLQRTACTTRAQSRVAPILNQLTGVSPTQIRQYITTTLDVLAEYPVDDHPTAVYLLKQLCAPVCPIGVDQAVFQVTLEVWRGHEDYLLTRSRSELLSSDTRGLGPRISNVIDYICTSNNLTTDMGLEMVCEGQIMMPRLRLYDVYTQIWCANPDNVNKPMRLWYRIPGLESDNLPYVEHLSPAQVPQEQYQHIAVLASHPHGLKDLLLRMATIVDPLKSRDLLDVIIHILKYCLKTPECRQAILSPELNSIPIILNTLLLCVNVAATHTEKVPEDFYEEIVGRLIQVLEPVLKMVDEMDDSGDANAPHVSVPKGDLDSLQRLLTCMVEQPDVPVVVTDVARLTGLLVFGDQQKADAIVEFVRTHLHKLKPSAEFSLSETALLNCCCSMLVFIPRHTRNGTFLKEQLVKRSGVLELSLRFLWDTVPESVGQLEEGGELDINDPAMAAFLAMPALPHVFQVLRACLDGSQNANSLLLKDTPAKSNITTQQLLRFFHWLETNKSAGKVGSLAEDMLSEWCPKSPALTDRRSSESDELIEPIGEQTLADLVCDLRKSTTQRMKKMAQNTRERQLRRLKMRMNEKGHISMMQSGRLTQLAAAVTDEPGLTCAICYEGFRNAPNEALGIYVYVRQCPLEESLVLASDSSRSANPPVPVPHGYSTLSNFVTVHFTCHSNSLKASSDCMWVVAQRHNRDARCNNLLPILSPPTEASAESKSKSKKDQPPSPDTVYAGHLAIFMDIIMRSLNVTPGYVMALHDVKLLLSRFACNRPFSADIGGGSRESNMQLLPHLIQVSLHSLLMSSSVAQKTTELDEYMKLDEKRWATSEHCWDTTGPLYYTVAALHLWSPNIWQANRVAILRRLIYLARGRLQHTKTSFETNSEEHVASFKPYLVFFGLVNAIYDYLFKDVPSGSSSTQSTWCASLSHYISTSDVALLSAVPKLLEFHQNDLFPSCSLEEFLDVTGLLHDVEVGSIAPLFDLSTE